MRLLLLLPVVLPLVGCATIRVTDPARTADEQFLQSQAIREAIQQLSFAALRNRSVYINTEYLLDESALGVGDQRLGSVRAVPEYERLYLIGEIRNRMLIEGVQLAAVPDAAEVILEVRSGGIGVNRSDFLLGIPGTDVAVGNVDVDGNEVPLILPELAIVKNIEQRGFASVSITAYFRDSGELVASSGPFVGRTIRTDYYFFGIGPRTSGDIPPADGRD